MSNIPALCNNCGTFFHSGVSLGNNANVTMINCSAGPCPSCGGMGSIPDGIFSSFGNAIRLISRTTDKAADLARLAQILAKAQKDNYTKEQVESEITQDVPELSSLASFFPQTRTELYAFLALFIAALTLYVSLSEEEKSFSDNDVEKVIEKVIEDSAPRPPQVPQFKEPEHNSSTKRKKIGRNEICYCGSGKKYKKCCLQSI